MPALSHRGCRVAGCPGYAVERGYCEAHRERAEAFTGAAYPAYGYNTSNTNKTFRRLRAGYLARHPLCALCGDAGGVLDHVIPHRGNPDLFWRWSNWQNLCVRCHNRKTAMECRGAHE